ncbi:ankyrin repeat-containing domain protein [Mycena metata]|uniref:Ankyrin repeat-containing domain protein n=1 Tax=Mycena metata TaxID=1033252 RepID=A0AAD7J952_9AGAR|nr:ankyrin repeat-containing domain protein [Mycena metata]
MALVPFTPLSLRVDPGIPQPAAADSDIADESTTNTTNNSNQVFTFRDRLSSMWQVVRSSDIQWGNTMNQTLGRLGKAALKAWGDSAHQAGKGPRAVATNIISLFGEEDDRVGNLAALQTELKILKDTIEKEDEKEVEIKKRIDLLALQTQCSRFMKYTLNKQTVEMQCVAFQRLVELTTMFPGLRLMLLRSEHIRPSKPTRLEGNISALWDRSHAGWSPDDIAEWRFWRSFAEMCLSEAQISSRIERCHISRVVQDHGKDGCLIGELSQVYQHCDAATEVMNALSIRYLGQIVALPKFWEQVKAADPARKDCSAVPHTTVDQLCVMMRKTLGDLESKGTKPLPFDYEGVDLLASNLLKGGIDILETVGEDFAPDYVGKWHSHFRMVVKHLRREWCKEYLPDSYHLAHKKIFKARISPGATETQGRAASNIDNENHVPAETEGTAAANVNDLFVASQNGHLDVVKFLIEHGADVNAENEDGCTSLYLASRNGRLEVVKFLIEHGANINASDNDGYTSLSIASANGHLDVVKFLIEHGADINAKDQDGHLTSLYVASANGHLDVVKFLIEHGANIGASNKDGWTSLYLASTYGRLKVVKFLIEHGADINASDKGGYTSLYVASANGHLEVVKFLIEHGADINAKTWDGYTSLAIASLNGHLDVVKFLIEHGADVNAKDKDGHTSLYIASQRGHRDIVKFLIEHGADTNAKNMDGQTSPLKSLVKKITSMLKLLNSPYMLTIIPETDGSTSLRIASDKRHVKFLVEKGVDGDV